MRTCSQATGAIDFVLHNAAMYDALRADAFALDTMLAHQQVNYVGALHVLAAVLPDFVARGAGHIAITGSVAGFRGLPKSLAYGPTKAALANLAEVLYIDLHARGIGVSLVQPGFVDTPLTAKNDFKMPALITPAAAAEAMLDGWRRGDFEIHFPRRFTFWMKLMRLLPYRLYFPAVARFTGLAERILRDKDTVGGFRAREGEGERHAVREASEAFVSMKLGRSISLSYSLARLPCSARQSISGKRRFSQPSVQPTAMSDRLRWMPLQKGLSARPLAMAATPSSTLVRWRSIQAALRSPSLRPAQVASRRQSTPASMTPSASASQVLTSARSRPCCGMSLPTGDSVSRYSTITRESNIASPPSMIRQGTLPSGLELAMVVSAAQTSSITNW
jgi:NAD(P)-dependent dehydrogenase (short-subunit alcohol dehydrogenase family)